jgi:hypothetical protein
VGEGSGWCALRREHPPDVRECHETTECIHQRNRPNTRRTLSRSPALVANARTFVLDGGYIISRYGFTAEPDFLYLLDRRTGRVLDRLELPSAPELIRRRGNRLYVRTYDHAIVAQTIGP